MEGRVSRERFGTNRYVSQPTHTVNYKVIKGKLYNLKRALSTTRS